MAGTDWKRVALVAFALIVFGNLANRYFEQRDGSSQVLPPPALQAVPELRVLSTSQSSEGVKESDFSPQLADKMAEYGAGRISAKIEAIYKQQGGAVKAPKIDSTATVVKSQERTLIVVRYEIEAKARSVEVIGVSGGDLHRVTCTRDSLEEILITSGPCAQKIVEVFNVKVGV